MAIGESGYWNKVTGRISASLDQSTETQELKNLQFAERLSAAQEAQILLNSDAQRILNRHLDEQQQADLFIKGQTLLICTLKVRYLRLNTKTRWLKLSRLLLKPMAFVLIIRSLPKPLIL